MIHVFPPRATPIGAVVDVTSRGKDEFRSLSPFLLGPVRLYGNHVSQNVENGWQYSKVYASHDSWGAPNSAYWHWAEGGWGKTWADRYPMGKGSTPRYSWWDGESLGYVQARKSIYVPLYSSAVPSGAIEKLRALHEQHGDLTIVDFDAYDHHALGMSLEDVLGDPTRKMGHGFVLAMMLE